MSALIETIKAAQLVARKQRNVAAAATLTTLIGEAEAIGKNSNRAPTDEEVVVTVKKFIKNVDATLEVLVPGSEIYATYAVEKTLLESFQPKQLSEEELTEKVALIISSMGEVTQKDMGKVMTALKAGFDGAYDGKLASQVVRRALGSVA